MKSFWRSTACGLLLAGLGLMTGGCEGEASDWKFENNSSYRVYVAANGQDWSPAMVDPGATIEVDYNGDTIQYVYTPSNHVRDQSGSHRTIHFYNR